MKELWKWIAKVLFYAVGVGLFVYAASRSLDFIQATLPASQKLVGYLGLLATGGGAIAWLAVFLFYAKGTGQKGLSLLFVVIDLLGEFALFTFDTLYRSGESGMIAALSADEIRMVVIGLSALIALNIAATFAFHIMDPETSKRMKEESARDVLDNEVLKTIEEKAPQLAQAMAPTIAAQWEQDFVTRFSNPYALGIGNLTTYDETGVIEARPKAKANGHGIPAWMFWKRKAQKPVTTTYEQRTEAVTPQGIKCPECGYMLYTDGYCPRCEKVYMERKADVPPTLEQRIAEIQANQPGSYYDAMKQGIKEAQEDAVHKCHNLNCDNPVAWPATFCSKECEIEAVKSWQETNAARLQELEDAGEPPAPFPVEQP